MDAFRQAMLTDGWVAEDARSHLLPHILAHLEAESGPLLLRAADEMDGLLVLELDAPAGLRAGDVRRAVFGAVGSVAEAATFVRELPTQGSGDVRTFELTTGSLEGDSSFAAHGHTVRIVVTHRDG